MVKIVRGSTLYNHETPLLDDLADLLYSGIALECLFPKMGGAFPLACGAVLCFGFTTAYQRPWLQSLLQSRSGHARGSTLVCRSSTCVAAVHVPFTVVFGGFQNRHLLSLLAQCRESCSGRRPSGNLPLHTFEHFPLCPAWRLWRRCCPYGAFASVCCASGCGDTQSYRTLAEWEFGWGGTSVITQHRCPKDSSVRTETSPRA